MTLAQALTKALAVCIAILHNFRNLGVALSRTLASTSMLTLYHPQTRSTFLRYTPNLSRSNIRPLHS